MVGWLLLFLLIPGAAFMLFAIFGMWMAFHKTQSPDQHSIPEECPYCGHHLTANASGKCPACNKPISFR
jgi:hypothetical protein